MHTRTHTAAALSIPPPTIASVDCPMMCDMLALKHENGQLHAAVAPPITSVAPSVGGRIVQSSCAREKWELRGIEMGGMLE